MKVDIQKISEKDIQDVARIYMEEFSKPPYNEMWTLEKAIIKLKRFMKYCDVWTILYEEKIVGFLAVNPNQWCPRKVLFGEEMAIAGDFQQRGIGSDVFKKIFELYKSKNYKTYMGIVNKNSKSYAFHTKLGITESTENVILEASL